MWTLRNPHASFQTKMKLSCGWIVFMALMCSTSLSQAMEHEKEQVNVVSRSSQPQDVSQEEMARVRCLWNLGGKAYKAAALEILEKEARKGANIKIRLKFLKKLGEFLKENPSHSLNLTFFDFSYQLRLSSLQEDPDSRLPDFYENTLKMISQSSLTSIEKSFQDLKLKTFYRNLSRGLTNENLENLTQEINRSFRSLQSSVGLNNSLLSQIEYFQNFYLRPQTTSSLATTNALERIAEDASKAAVSTQNSKEAASLRRLANKICFKLAQNIPSDIPVYKRISRQQSYYNQSAQLGHHLSKYYLAELYNTEKYGDTKSEFYDPDTAYSLYLRAANEGHPLAAHKLAKILEVGNDALAIDPNKGSALNWHAQAAKMGHPHSQYELACASTENRIQFLHQSAESGYSKAQLELAKSYQEGQQVTKNPSFALVWYEKAANQEETEAYYPLGYAYEKGIGTAKNEEKAFHFYNLSSQAGNAQAHVRLGKIYLKGKGEKEKNEDKALVHFQKASEQGNSDGKYYIGLMNFKESKLPVALDNFKAASQQGHSKAYYRLGLMQQFGIGGEQNYANAKTFYEKAGENGLSLYSLGWLYKRGLGVVKNQKQALLFWIKAAELENREAAFRAGKACLSICLEKEDKEKAEKAHFYLNQSALLFPDALYLLGLMQEKGIGCEKSPEKAMNYYIQAAEAGYSLAQFKLGYFYEKLLEPGHEKKAFDYYKHAAEHHHVGALLSLGCFYQSGKGTVQNLEQAFVCLKSLENELSSSLLKEMKQLAKKGYKNALDWLETQAKQGNAYAQNYLGRALEEGLLIKQDTTKAISFYQQAALKGNRAAQLRLADLKRNHLFEALQIKKLEK